MRRWSTWRGVRRAVVSERDGWRATCTAAPAAAADAADADSDAADADADATLPRWSRASPRREAREGGGERRSSASPAMVRRSTSTCGGTQQAVLAARSRTSSWRAGSGRGRRSLWWWRGGGGLRLSPRRCRCVLLLSARARCSRWRGSLHFGGRLAASAARRWKARGSPERGASFPPPPPPPPPPSTSAAATATAAATAAAAATATAAAALGDNGAAPRVLGAQRGELQSDTLLRHHRLLAQCAVEQRVEAVEGGSIQPSPSPPLNPEENVFGRFLCAGCPLSSYGGVVWRRQRRWR